jgi:hypothetical protein
MVRYIISCKWCEFRAETTSLAVLGSQMNAHACVCHDEPSLEEEDGTRAVGAENALDRDLSRVRLPA